MSLRQVIAKTLPRYKATAGGKPVLAENSSLIGRLLIRSRLNEVCSSICGCCVSIEAKSGQEVESRRALFLTAHCSRWLISQFTKPRVDARSYLRADHLNWGMFGMGKERKTGGTCKQHVGESLFEDVKQNWTTQSH